jgi:hypothetical protein
MAVHFPAVLTNQSKEEELMNNKVRKSSGILLLIAVSMLGCSRERNSDVVRMVEKAGAGDVRAATIRSLAQWFDRHPAVAIKAAHSCKPIRASAEARWPETTEGRVRDAAAQVAGFLEWRREVEKNNDHKTFQGGSR